MNEKHLKSWNIKKGRLESWSTEKERLSTEWIENEFRERGRFIKQGEIYTCDVGENIGSEIRGHEKAGEEIAHVRPVLVISDTRFNNNGLLTVLPLTSTVKTKEDKAVPKRISPTIKNHYILRKSNYEFLKNDSTISPNQIRSISSIRLKHFLGSISEDDLPGIKNRLKTFFGI